MSEFLEVEDPPFDPFEGTTTTALPPLPPIKRGAPASGNGVLDRVRTWLATYVCTMHEEDLDLLTLWAAHTYLVNETYTTPRLIIDSPVPGSGKTTVLDHLQRLSFLPMQAASISSPALIPRILAQGPRTILMDEVDRNLDPKRDGVQDLLAIINAGYRRGATRPVLIPGKDGTWDFNELPTYAAIAMAGNAPNLPDDTLSRSIRLLLLPDLEDRVEPSDWEEIEIDAKDLGESLSQWADEVRDFVRSTKPDLPAGCTGRSKERWAPLRRVAEAAGGPWPQKAIHLINRDMEEIAMDKEDSVRTYPPHMTLLHDLLTHWPQGEQFWESQQVCDMLITVNPGVWGPASNYGSALTTQRLGRMLAKSFKINSDRPGNRGKRGYTRDRFERVWTRMGLTTPITPLNNAGNAGNAVMVGQI